MIDRRRLLTNGAFGLGAAMFAGRNSARSAPAARRALLDQVTQIAIYPSIGIARIGNSPDE